MAGKDDGDDGSSSVMSGSYVIEGGRTTSNFPSTAALAWTTTAAECGGLDGRFEQEILDNLPRRVPGRIS